jgi:hypothetical protein
VEVKNGWRRTRDAVILGVIWAVVWAPIAVLIGTMIVDPDNSMDEMWVLIGAYPGFLCAVIFSVVLAIAERGRRLHEVSLSRVRTWGMLAGLLVGVFPFTVGTSTSALPLWQLGVAVIGSITLLSALSAVGSALVARVAKKRELRDASADMA